jgi:hypothetical protein
MAGLDDVLKKLNSLQTTDPPEEPAEKPAEPQVANPDPQWYQISDWFSRQDELLSAILQQLQRMEAIESAPPIPPEVPELPSGINTKLADLLVLTNAVKKALEGMKTITGQGTVAIPRTAVELVSTIPTYAVIIKANSTNTGDIYIGDRGVSAASGYIMNPGDAIALPVDNKLKSIWMDVANAGDGASWIAMVME